MNTRMVAALAAGCVWVAFSMPLVAADTWPTTASMTTDWPYDASTVVTVVLGTQDDRLIAAPKRHGMTVGETYRLVVMNPSRTTHYFWAPEFGGYGVWTDRVAVDKADAVLRTAGAPGEEYSTWEIRVEPGGTAVWSFVPEIAGLYTWGCSVPAHEEAGMTGEFDVTEG